VLRRKIPSGEKRDSQQGEERKAGEGQKRDRDEGQEEKGQVRKEKNFQSRRNEMSAHEKGKRWAVSRFILWLVDGGKEQDIAEIFSAATATAGSLGDVEGSAYIEGVLAGWQAGSDQLGLLAALAPDEASA